MIDESLHNISCCLHICKVHKYINLWFATRIIVILLSIFDRLELFAYTIVFVYIHTVLKLLCLHMSDIIWKYKIIENIIINN